MINETLYIDKNPHIDLFYGMLKQDREKARIILLNDKQKYTIKKILVTKDSKRSKNFVIINHTENINMSINNRVYYTTQSKTCYIHKDNKFWYSYNEHTKKIFKPVCFNDFTGTKGDVIGKYILPKFKWLEIFRNTKYPEIKSIPFNSIIKYKLFTEEQCLAYLYKTDYKTALTLYNLKLDNYEFKLLKKYLINIEIIGTLGLVEEKIFINKYTWGRVYNNEFITFILNLSEKAKILNRKVDCSLSKDELRDTLTKWNNEIKEVIKSNKYKEELIKEMGVSFIPIIN